MFTVSDDWREAYPGAFAGVLVMTGVSNPEHHPELDRQKKELEEELRTLFTDRGQLKTLPPIQAYRDYYKRFKKTYHVQLQLESVLLKGKSIPGMRALVKAMVSAELKNQLLTAGHDVTKLDGALVADVASGEERYTRFGGREQQLKQDDMFISDGTGIVSSVLYGPDARTSLGDNTEHVCFTVYAVQGIAAHTVKSHLGDIRDAVLLVAPDAAVEMLEFVNGD